MTFYEHVLVDRQRPTHVGDGREAFARLTAPLRSFHVVTPLPHDEKSNTIHFQCTCRFGDSKYTYAIARRCRHVLAERLLTDGFDNSDYLRVEHVENQEQHLGGRRASFEAKLGEFIGTNIELPISLRLTQSSRRYSESCKILCDFHWRTTPWYARLRHTSHATLTRTQVFYTFRSPSAPRDAMLVVLRRAGLSLRRPYM